MPCTTLQKYLDFSPSKSEELQMLRSGIDEIDEQLLFLLAERKNVFVTSAKLAPEDTFANIKALNPTFESTKTPFKELNYSETIFALLDSTASLIEDVREVANAIDADILELLLERNERSQEIGAYKREENLPPLDSKRWKEVLQDRIEKGKDLSLDPDLIQKVWEEIHQESLRQQ